MKRSHPMKVTMETSQAPKRAKRKKRTKAASTGAPSLAHRGGSPAARARRKGTVCSRCNKHHVLPNGKPSCNGHKRKVRPYQPCSKPPVNGAAVCRLHGALLPVAKAAAERRVQFAAVEGEVAALLRECDLPEQHPIDGLLEVVRHSGAMMRLLGSLCAQLDLDPGDVRISENEKGDTKRYTTSEDGLYGYNNAGDQTAHILVQMYGQWADRYARACKTALDANIDERLVRNAENTTNAVYIAITRAIDKASLTITQQQEFSVELANQLRKLAGPLELPRGA